MNQKPLIKTMMCVAIALSACGQITPIATVSPPTNTATLPPTATLVPTPIATVDLLQEANIVERCPTILPSTDLPEIKASGVIVFLKNSDYIGIIRQAFLLNSANNQLFEFSRNGENLSYYSIAVSPDHKTLAYGILRPKAQNSALILTNSKGERQETIPSGSPYPFGVSIWGWVNNQQLLLNPNTVFNPYSKERQSFNPEDFPDILPNDLGVYFLEFDPTVTRVIYHSFDKTTGSRTTALADLASKQILAQLPGTVGMLEIAWLSDGNFAAIVEGTQELKTEEIFLIDHNGKEIRQLTKLSTYYGTGYYLWNLSWSPDGSRIAFWQDDTNPDGKGLRLFVLDTKTEELTSYCTWGEYRNTTTFYGPIWSPDGRQLLIGDLSIKDTVRAVVIDTEKNIAIVIADDAIPVGWMSGE